MKITIVLLDKLLMRWQLLVQQFSHIKRSAVLWYSAVLFLARFWRLSSYQIQNKCTYLCDSNLGAISIHRLISVYFFGGY